MAEDKRTPLSFWSTVGAVVTAGVVTSAVTFGIGVLFVGLIAGRAASQALEGAGMPPQNNLPPGGGAG